MFCVVLSVVCRLVSGLGDLGSSETSGERHWSHATGRWLAGHPAGSISSEIIIQLLLIGTFNCFCNKNIQRAAISEIIKPAAPLFIDVSSTSLQCKSHAFIFTNRGRIPSACVFSRGNSLKWSFLLFTLQSEAQRMNPAELKGKLEWVMLDAAASWKWLETSYIFLRQRCVLFSRTSDLLNN